MILSILITILKIIGTIFLLSFIWVFFKFGLKKGLVILKWFLVLIPFSIFAFLTSWAMCIPAGLIDFVLGKFYKYNPLFPWLDFQIKSNPKDWRTFMTKFPKWVPKFLARMIRWWMWHSFRNPMWNIMRKLKRKNTRINGEENYEKIIDLCIDELYRNGVKLEPDAIYEEMAGLKWRTHDGKEGFLVFTGVSPTKKYSNIGTSYLWYEAFGELLFRYSTVRPVYLFKKRYWIYFAIGYSYERPLLNFKKYKYQKLV